MWSIGKIIINRLLICSGIGYSGLFSSLGKELEAFAGLVSLIQCP